ncbi:uncharacterized protein LOC135806120 [Sycon ciliatum]|uniref:uncharacterized protein LOC135806120 n=1 Tax=Sycon ciliatum TaxID=27933 RepID=UPI0031F71DA3
MDRPPQAEKRQKQQHGARAPASHRQHGSRAPQIIKTNPMPASHSTARLRSAPKLAITAKSSTAGVAPVGKRKAPVKPFSTLARETETAEATAAPIVTSLARCSAEDSSSNVKNVSDDVKNEPDDDVRADLNDIRPEPDLVAIESTDGKGESDHTGPASAASAPSQSVLAFIASEIMSLSATPSSVGGTGSSSQNSNSSITPPASNSSVDNSQVVESSADLSTAMAPGEAMAEDAGEASTPLLLDEQNAAATPSDLIIGEEWSDASTPIQADESATSADILLKSKTGQDEGLGSQREPSHEKSISGNASDVPTCMPADRRVHFSPSEQVELKDIERMQVKPREKAKYNDYLISQHEYDAVVQKASRKKQIQEEFAALRNKMKADNSRKDILRVTCRRAPTQFKVLSAVQKLEPKTRHALDKDSIHYFCHPHHITSQLPLPVMIASLLSHPNEPQVIWRPRKPTVVHPPPQATTKGDADGQTLSMERSKAVLQPLLDRMDKELVTTTEWLPKSIVEQLTEGDAQPSDSASSQTNSETMVDGKVNSPEMGKSHAMEASRQHSRKTKLDKSTKATEDHSDIKAETRPWKPLPVPKRVAGKQWPLRSMIEPSTVQKKMCKVYNPAESHELVMDLLHTKEARDAADLENRRRRDAEMRSMAIESVFRSRMYRRRSYSICDMSLSFFDNTKASPLKIDTGTVATAETLPLPFRAALMCDGTAPVTTRCSVHRVFKLDVSMPASVAEEQEQTDEQQNLTRLEFELRRQPALRKWKSCPNLPYDTVLTLDTSYSITMEEMKTLQQSLLAESNKSQAAAVATDADSGGKLSTQGSMVNAETSSKPPAKVHRRRTKAKMLKKKPSKAASVPEQSRHELQLPSDIQVRDMKRKMVYRGWAKVDFIVRALRETPPDRTMRRRKSLSRLPSMVTRDETMEPLGVIEVPAKPTVTRRSLSTDDVSEVSRDTVKTKEPCLRGMVEEIENARFRSLSVPRVLPAFTQLRDCSKDKLPLTDYDWTKSKWTEWYDDYWRSKGIDPEEASRVDGMKRFTSLPFENGKTLRELSNVAPAIADSSILSQIKLEVQRLTPIADSKLTGSALRATAYCRRGALLMKLGELRESFHDMTRALAICPHFTDALWYRHLLWLLQNQDAEALSDLNNMIFHDGSSVRAYRARGDLKLKLGKLSDAVLNYTSAISLAPDDPELYFQRAQLYETTKEMGFAMADYEHVVSLQQSSTEALWRLTRYLFSNGRYRECLDGLTLLVEQTNDKEAYLYRGQVFVELGQPTDAVKDFSSAIALDPDCILAYYYRGRILMKAHWERALKDFSMALLLDHEVSISGEVFLHRGVIYALHHRFDEAIRDFKSAVTTNSQDASALVCLGLIYKNYKHDTNEAMRYINMAIVCKPTYDRAHACRAHLHSSLNESRAAVIDYTKAILLQPCVPQYWLFRGRLLLSLDKQKLAQSDICTAARLVAGMDATPVQQAVVNLFLENEDKAIRVLRDASHERPGYNILFELGKALMKTSQFDSAMSFFKRALFIKEKIAAPSQKKQVVKGIAVRIQMDKRTARDIAECHFLIGKCQMGLQRTEQAVQSFNTSLKYNDGNAKVYYERGVAYITRNQRRALSDLHKSISISRDMYDAYVTRAAVFGMRKELELAIINCNNAIRLRPRSVRAHLYRAMFHFEKGLLDEALSDLCSCLSLDPACSLALYNRAIVHTAMGNRSMALNDNSTVLLLCDETNSDYKHLVTNAYLNRAMIYYEMKRYDCALADYQQVILLDFRGLDVYHAISVALMRSGFLRQAVDGFTYVLGENPRSVEACVSRGMCFWEYCHPVGDAMAIHDFSRAILLNPLYTKAYIDLGLCLQMKGCYRQAWYQFTTAITIDPDCVISREARAILNLQLREFDAALQDINVALRVKETASLLTTRAVINTYACKRQLAMYDLEKAIALEPTSFLAQFNAGCLAAQQRHYAKAMECFDTAVKLCPDDDYATLNNRAILLAITKNPRGAERDLSTASRLCPSAAFVHLNRGHILRKLNNIPAAVDAYTQAINADSSFLAAFKARAVCHERLGKAKNALADFQQVLELDARE